MLARVLEILCRSTAELGQTGLASIRALMNATFGERFDDHDWDHTLGGDHILGHRDGELVAHASVVPRTLWCGQQPRHTGYVEAVAVDPVHQRRGFGSAVMAEAERVIRHRYELGALCAGDDAQRLYRRLGWVVWHGPSFVATAAGRVATPAEDGYILVLPQPGLDLAAAITCDWRDGDVW